MSERKTPHPSRPEPYHAFAELAMIRLDAQPPENRKLRDVAASLITSSQRQPVSGRSSRDGRLL